MAVAVTAAGKQLAGNFEDFAGLDDGDTAGSRRAVATIAAAIVSGRDWTISRWSNLATIRPRVRVVAILAFARNDGRPQQAQAWPTHCTQRASSSPLTRE